MNCSEPCACKCKSVMSELLTCGGPSSAPGSSTNAPRLAGALRSRHPGSYMRLGVNCQRRATVTAPALNLKTNVMSFHPASSRNLFFTLQTSTLPCRPGHQLATSSQDFILAWCGRSRNASHFSLFTKPT